MLSKKYADKLRSIFILKFYLKFQDEKKYILKNMLAWKIMTISVELPQIFFKKCQKAPELNSVVLLELWTSLWFQAGSLYTYFFSAFQLFLLVRMKPTVNIQVIQIHAVWCIKYAVQQFKIQIRKIPNFNRIQSLS